MNIREEVIHTHSILEKGGVILYPTDTIWGLGCDAMNVSAVKRIFEIKKRSFKQSMLILLDLPEKLSFYVEHIPVIAWDLIENVNRPTTFIYPKGKNVPDQIIAEDGSIAIRITKNEFCKKLIGMLGNPIVSTSANVSGQPTPARFKEISQDVIDKVDYVVNPDISAVEDVKPSSIIRFMDDYSFEVVRE